MSVLQLGMDVIRYTHHILTERLLTVGEEGKMMGERSIMTTPTKTSSATTTIGRLVTDLVEQHPGWSHTKIAREIDDNHPDLFDALFNERREYLTRYWVMEIVGRIRRDHRDKLKTGEVMAALHPDGQRQIYKLGEMTGTKVVALGERYLAAGERLTDLGHLYIRLGTTAGRRKIKTVFNNEELETMFSAIKEVE